MLEEQLEAAQLALKNERRAKVLRPGAISNSRESMDPGLESHQFCKSLASGSANLRCGLWASTRGSEWSTQPQVAAQSKLREMSAAKAEAALATAPPMDYPADADPRDSDVDEEIQLVWGRHHHRISSFAHGCRRRLSIAFSFAASAREGRAGQTARKREEAASACRAGFLNVPFLVGRPIGHCYGGSTR